jgi:hypothetical protein
MNSLRWLKGLSAMKGFVFGSALTLLVTAMPFAAQAPDAQQSAH